MGGENLRHIRPVEQLGLETLARISVTGSQGLYFVRLGNSAPVRVRAVRGTLDSLKCECGVYRCVHIASLLMCGFVDSEEEGAQAA
ncbi:MAG: hypothetical protein M3014_03110 [Chloroflexota bacterium]|nr:hypothetical protein [Chloroflexota bacterium]